MSMFAIIKICLLAIAETGFAGHFAVSKFIDIITIGFGGNESLSFAKRVLIFSGRGVER